MANPIYHDDPEWYERPGETVYLEVDKRPTVFAMGGLVWSARPTHLPPAPDIEEGVCSVCGKARYVYPSGLCSFCSRAQAKDETHLARAKQPQPSGPRIHGLREGWER